MPQSATGAFLRTFLHFLASVLACGERNVKRKNGEEKNFVSTQKYSSALSQGSDRKIRASKTFLILLHVELSISKESAITYIYIYAFAYLSVERVKVGVVSRVKANRSHRNVCGIVCDGESLNARVQSNRGKTATLATSRDSRSMGVSSR